MSQSLPSFARETVLLVDGNNVSLRAFHGCARLTDMTGFPTACIFTTIRTICQIAAQVMPTRTIVFWDSGHSNWRKQIHPGYKDRGEMTDERKLELDEWKMQVSALKSYLPMLGIGQIALPGCEADDLIYRVSREFVAADWDVILATTDADFYQLLNDNLVIYHLGSESIVWPDDVLEKYGVTVSQWIDYRAMLGDKSDRIDGVAGIGPVKARDILLQFGTLDLFFSTIEELNPNWLDENGKKHHRVLAESKDLIERNRMLMDMSRLPPYEINNEQLQEATGNALDERLDKKAFWAVCQKHNFNTLMQESHLWQLFRTN